MNPELTTQADAAKAWDAIAGGFDDKVTPITTAMSAEALERVDLRPGMRFLDVAAGSGALAIPAAERGARVLGTDIAPTMVARLEARARREKLDLEARVMDAYDLDLDDDTFDVAGSQNGVSLLPDLERGLKELVRVTRPDGQVMVVAFADLRDAEFLTFPFRAIQQTVPGFTGIPTDPPPLPFQMADPAKMRRDLESAGLDDVHVDTITWSAPFHSAREVMEVLSTSNPIGTGIVQSLTPAQRAAAEEALDRALAERTGGDGPAALHTRVNVGVGTVR